MEKHLILGHSFCRKLFEFCVNNEHYNMNLNNSTVHFAGYLGDRRIVYADQVGQWLDRYGSMLHDFSVAVIDVGCNDLLSCTLFLQPVKLAEIVYKLALRTRKCGVKRVVLMQMLFRSGRGAVPRWTRASLTSSHIRRCQYDYNDAVKRYNRRLWYLCSQGDGTVVYRTQRGFHRNWSQRLLRDGVHPNGLALVSYFSNVRSALIVEGMKTRRT